MKDKSTAQKILMIVGIITVVPVLIYALGKLSIILDNFKDTIAVKFKSFKLRKVWSFFCDIINLILTPFFFIMGAISLVNEKLDKELPMMKEMEARKAELEIEWNKEVTENEARIKKIYADCNFDIPKLTHKQRVALDELRREHKVKIHKMMQSFSKKYKNMQTSDSIEFYNDRMAGYNALMLEERDKALDLYKTFAKENGTSERDAEAYVMLLYAGRNVSYDVPQSSD